MKRWLIIGLMTVTLAGCQNQDKVTETPVVPPEPEKDYVLADLALSLPASPAGTRQSEGMVQTAGKDFRGINKLSIIPFASDGLVGADDKPSYYETNTSYQDLMENVPAPSEHWLYYNKVYLMRGVSAFLTYGQASKTVPSLPDPLPSNLKPKAFYGSLVTKTDGEVTDGIPDRIIVTPSSLTFELEPIYAKTEAPSEATFFGNYLTTIAEAQVGDYKWKNMDNTWLKNLYLDFVQRDRNNMDAEEYHVVAGSSANMKAYVNALNAKLIAQLNKTVDEEGFGEGSMEQRVARNIQYRLESYSEVLGGRRMTVSSDGNGGISLTNCDNYPASLGLPDGAAVLQWDKTSSKFLPRTETSPLANICNINRYVYPAELYYISNSTIRTSSEEVSTAAYTGTWADVLAHYTSGTVVTASTKAVAMEKTMQYAVAHLSARIKAATETLNDIHSRAVPINKLPITGIIISGQNPVGFDFVPETVDTGEDTETFVYDHYLNEGNELYMQTAFPDTYPIHTLLMQTKNDNDITVILELRNDDDEAFESELGIVYPGTKFYLLGKIRIESNAVVSDDWKKRAFTQDYTTILNMNVNTLVNAYNVMPNVQADHLQVSVEIVLNWTQAEPTKIEFEEDDQ